MYSAPRIGHFENANLSLSTSALHERVSRKLPNVSGFLRVTVYLLFAVVRLGGGASRRHS